MLFDLSSLHATLPNTMMTTHPSLISNPGVWNALVPSSILGGQKMKLYMGNDSIKHQVYQSQPWSSCPYTFVRQHWGMGALVIRVIQRKWLVKMAGLHNRHKRMKQSFMRDSKLSLNSSSHKRISSKLCSNSYMSWRKAKRIWKTLW